MRVTVVVNLRVEGFHRWPDAAKYSEEVKFLADEHRHMFHIKAAKEVSHLNRDIEIILFKRQITDYLIDEFGTPCKFDSMSCEEIAKTLVVEYNLEYCEVLEDGENGSCVTK